MASVNKVILIGNLGRDPEVRYMPSGDAMANLNIATTDTWKDKGGEKQERTEWHRVVMFGKQAEIAGEYLKKGSQVYIEGRCRHANGRINLILSDIPPRSSLIACKCWVAAQAGGNFESADREGEYSNSASYADKPANYSKTGSGFDDLEDDIPF